MKIEDNKILVEQQTGGKTGGTDVVGKTGGTDVVGKTGGTDVVGKTGGANAGDQGSVNTDLHPKDQSEGDAFRKWMSEKYPEFRCDDKVKSKLEVTGKFNNNCIKKAWKTYKEEFRKKDNSNVPSDDKKTDKPADNTKVDNKPENVKNNPDYNCQPWLENNSFISDFPDSSSIMSVKFANWAYKQKTNDYSKLRSQFDKSCIETGTNLKYYQDNKLYHQSPLIRELSKLFYNDWKASLGQSTNTTTAAKKDTQTPNQQTQQKTNNGNQDFVDMYQESKSMNPLVIAHRTTRNATEQKGREKGCWNLVELYIEAATKGYEKYFPNTQKGFIKTLSEVKKTVFGCVSGKNPGLRKRQDEILKLNNLKSPWKINTVDANDPVNTMTNEKKSLNIESIIKQKLTIMKEMKPIKDSVRKKLVERKSISDKNVGAIKKNLDKIFEDFRQEDYNKFYNRLTKLTNAYQSSKISLNESADVNFNKAFNSFFQDDEEKETAKQTAINYFMSKFNVSGPLANNIKSEMEKISPDEVSRMFTDSDYLANFVVNGIIETSHQEAASGDGDLMAIMQGVLTDSLKTSESVLKRRVSRMIDSVQQKLRDNTVQTRKSFIDSVLSSKIS